jgi:hypothetical protein
MRKCIYCGKPVRQNLISLLFHKCRMQSVEPEGKPNE